MITVLIVAVGVLAVALTISLYTPGGRLRP
jgi:Tfp pilus assembly protein PilV